MAIWVNRVCEYLLRVHAVKVAAFAGLSLAIGLGAGVVKAQSLQEMAGQMIVVGFSGDDVGDSGVQAALDDVAGGRVGGVMFLGVNVKSRAATLELTQAFLDAAPNLPPLITIDQEGGLVERLTSKVGFIEAPKPIDVARGGIGPARQTYARMANGLFEWGFNVNFGPVADLNINTSNPIIAKFGRSYGATGDIVTQFSSAFISAHRASNVITALKHFPGHGSSADDSHEGFVDISRSWQTAELYPYRMLAAADMIDMVMVGHLFADVGKGGDSTQYPATLSRVWVQNVLRDDIGFNGVVVSDDMEMGAIRQHYGFAEAIVRAVNAGVDILLYSNTVNARGSLPEEILAVLMAEAEGDPAFRARIEESYRRIVALKQGL